ncbi:MAG: tol-pal system-associated acyl-CoA thioesterase [Reyranellaceae bacterium]
MTADAILQRLPEIARSPSGLIAEGRHWYALRVFYEDTDAAGIVYYANYLRFVERARTEMMRLLGYEHSALRESTGVNWTVRHCAVDYRRPARLDDQLLVDSVITALGGASLDIAQTVRKGSDILVIATLKLACMRPDGRPARLPAGLRESLSRVADAPLTPQSTRKSQAQ